MKKRNNKEKKDSGYGLLSMMAMIIGIVIGSGIFVKNSSLLGINGSIVLTVISWTVGALIVITIVIAFFEIISITEITSEQSTMYNWSRYLCGIRFGKFVGYFFSFTYFPIVIAALFIFSGNQFMTALNGAHLINWSTSEHYKEYFVGTIVVSAVFAIIVLSLNAFYKKPGKYLQNIGTAIKTIPLFFIIIVLLVMIISNIGKINFDVPNNIKKTSTTNVVLLVFMTMPPILFSFDGFVFAGTLSKEAKSESTFKFSFIISMLFIITIYILFSVAIFGLSNKNDKDYGTITNAIMNVMPVAGKIIAPIIVFIVFMSILTGVSGCTIACGRMFSDLSAQNAVLDKKGKWISKNKYGVSSSAGLWVMLATLIWFVIGALFDGSLIFSASNSTDAKDVFLTTSGYMSNLIVIGGFLLYSVVMIAGLVNRFTKKVKVKKNILFIPASLIAGVMTLVITSYFAWTTIVPPEPSSNADQLSVWASNAIFWAHLVFFILFVFDIIITLIYNLKNTKNIDSKIIKLKEEKLKTYYKEPMKKNINKN